MVSAVTSAMQGLQAYGTKLNSSANNIANASTEGFKKTRVTLSEQVPQGVKANVETVDSPGNSRSVETDEGLQNVEFSNVDLTEELPDSLLNARFYQANLKTLQTTEEMTASLVNIKA